MGNATNNTRQAAWVALGNFFTFSFGIVSAMVFSRYFDKTEYGTYKQVFYIYNILLGMFTLGLPNAYSYFLARSPLDQAKNLIWKMIRLFMILGLVMSVVLLFGAGIISGAMNNPDLKEMLIIFAPVPFLMLPTLGLQNILVTFRRSNIIPIYVIVTSITQLAGVLLPVIVWHLGCKGALIGFNISSLVAFSLALYLNTYPVRNYAGHKSEDSYKDIFSFAFPLFIATIWGTLINSTDQFFISRYFGTEVFADFSNGATELPFVGMIIGATSAVLTPLFTRSVKEGGDLAKTILPVWNSAFAKSAMLIYPITIFCFFEANLIIVTMYGDLYTASADFFKIKLLGYFVKIIAFYSIIIALGATRFYQKVFMYTFIFLVISEYISVKLFDSPLLITGIHVFSTIMTCLVFILYISRRFNAPFHLMFPIKTLIKVVIISVFASVLVLIIRHGFYNTLQPLPTIIIDFSAFFIIYLLMSSLFKNNYMPIIQPLLRKE